MLSTPCATSERRRQNALNRLSRKVSVVDRYLLAVIHGLGDEASQRFEAAKKDSKEKVAATRDKLSTASEEAERGFKALEAEVWYEAQSTLKNHPSFYSQEQQKDPEEHWTSESVAVALETEQAKLDLNHATDAGVIETYEARTREVRGIPY